MNIYTPPDKYIVSSVAELGLYVNTLIFEENMSAPQINTHGFRSQKWYSLSLAFTLNCSNFIGSFAFS